MLLLLLTKEENASMMHAGQILGLLYSSKLLCFYSARQPDDIVKFSMSVKLTFLISSRLRKKSPKSDVAPDAGQ